MMTSWRILLVIACLWFVYAPEAEAGRRLKGAVEVSGAQVTLADLFDGDAADPAWANVQVSPAPAPGGRLVLRSSEVVALAQRSGAFWDSATSSATITVTRRGVAVPLEVMEKRIAAALPAGKGHGDIQLTSPNRTLMVASANDFAAVKVTRFHYDDRSESFNVTLAYPNGNGGFNSETLTGRLIAMTDLPVLSTTVSPGDVITADNIDWMRLPTQQVSGQMIANTDDIVGMAARRALRPGVPLRLSDIQRPRLVKRGDLVTMVLVSPGVTLTATGKALENGAKGDRIRLMNTASHRTVEGAVVSPRQVMVNTNLRVAAQQY